MKLVYTGFKVSVNDSSNNLLNLVSQKLKINKDDILDIIIMKESIDARNKSLIVLNYNLILDIKDKTAKFLLKYKNIKPYTRVSHKLEYKKWDKPYSPVIVGFGPSGMMAALYLARCGANPIVLERGSEVDERVKDVEAFLKTKKLNPNSNIQFGEGGAGTFSDGKLTTNAHDPLISFILDEFVRYGAKEEIKFNHMPHIGTDYLRIVVKNLRNDLISLGAKFYFNTTFTDYDDLGNSLLVHTDKGLEFKTSHLILGLGHSARDTIRMLYKKGISMVPKSFSMGVRIEHKREDINKIQFGEHHHKLAAATYKMAVHLENRSVYTFCMCPGGEVMASQSEKESIVTNGMSYQSRALENSNAALLVNVDPKDYYINSPLDGMDYQEKYEKLAYSLSKDYKAPANLVKEFLNEEVAKEIRSISPTYPHGIYFCDLKKCLPEYVEASLRQAIPLFDKKMHGFNNPDAVLTAIESRTSSPVRILRDESNACNNKMIYPIGEGAGYAGGIMTSALDGLKTAIKILE